MTKAHNIDDDTRRRMASVVDAFRDGGFMAEIVDDNGTHHTSDIKEARRVIARGMKLVMQGKYRIWLGISITKRAK